MPSVFDYLKPAASSLQYAYLAEDGFSYREIVAMGVSGYDDYFKDVKRDGVRPSKKPPTPKQIDWLQARGFDVAELEGFTMANVRNIIGNYLLESKEDPHYIKCRAVRDKNNGRTTMTSASKHEEEAEKKAMAPDSSQEPIAAPEPKEAPKTASSTDAEAFKTAVATVATAYADAYKAKFGVDATFTKKPIGAKILVLTKTPTAAEFAKAADVMTKMVTYYALVHDSKGHRIDLDFLLTHPKAEWLFNLCLEQSATYDPRMAKLVASGLSDEEAKRTMRRGEGGASTTSLVAYQDQIMPLYHRVKNAAPRGWKFATELNPMLASGARPTRTDLDAVKAFIIGEAQKYGVPV